MNYLKINAASDNVELIAPVKTVFQDGMGYYTPEIDAEGNLTWVPSNDDIPDVSESVNIMGPAGKDGVPGVDGKPGPKGEPGNSGVYIGSIEPTDANVWIDPEAAPETDYVTKDYVDEKINEMEVAAGSVSSVNGKAGAVVLTAEDVGALPADTVIPDTTGLATTEYVDKAVENVNVDLSGYATEDYVDKAIQDAQLGGGDVEVDLTNYYTMAETDAVIADELEPYALKTDIPASPDLSGYALKTEIPDTTGFITETALEPYALKTEVPSIEGLATEQYVDDAIANIPTSGGGEGGGAAADEKTIITNSEGKLETAIGGYVSEVIVGEEKANYTGEFTNSATNTGWVVIGKAGGVNNLPSSWFRDGESMDFYITLYDASEDTTHEFIHKGVFYTLKNNQYHFEFSGNPYLSYVFIDYPSSTNAKWTIQDISSAWERTVDKIISFRACTSDREVYSPINVKAIPFDGTTIIEKSGLLSSSISLMKGTGVDAIQSLEQNDGATSGNYAVNFGQYNSAKGLCSFTVGNQNSIGSGSYQYAVAMGYKNTCKAMYAGAINCNNTVSGIGSFACGDSNTVAGARGFAAGGFNNINSTSTAAGIALGAYLTTASPYQTTIGKYNLSDSASTYGLIVGNGDSSTKTNAMTVAWTGDVNAAGAFTGSGADYAEYFEWLDGNPEAEDRVGYIVALSGKQIRYAQPEDDVLGIISGTAMVLGDNAEWNWQGKFLKDDFGRIIYDMKEQFTDIPEVDEEGNETIKTVSTGFFPVPRLNPNYNPEETYVKRSERAEWATVGLMGKLYVRDDGTCAVGGYAAAGANGVATSSTGKTNMRVMERCSENIIKVLLK